MSIAIEGYCVVVLQEKIGPLLEENQIEPPNSTSLSDNHVWRCGFMAEEDANAFVGKLQSLGLNTDQGPTPDAVLISEFSLDMTPYCEWFQVTRWKKAVIGWKVGTDPKKLMVHQGWDPNVGSGLVLHQPSEDDLEFLRLEPNNIVVYRDKSTGKELYISRTEPPLDAMFRSAGDVINQHLVTAGAPTLQGEAFEEVQKAVEMMAQILEHAPNSWRTLWFHGKGMIALGKLDSAYDSLSKAWEIEKNEEIIPRELGGVCLELGKYDEAVSVNQAAVGIEPDNSDLLANLALALMMAARIPESEKAIAAALKISPDDPINLRINEAISKIASGAAVQPRNMDDLEKITTEH